MIISRTPYRISFFGGGTDYPGWYRTHGGSVLATTINKFCYLTCRYLPPFFEHNIRIVWSKIELCKTRDEIQHPAVRAILEYLKIDRGLEIHYDGDLPAKGGTGSSSSFAVGLLNALYALQGRITSKDQLAKEAIHIEQEVLKETVGSQDQVMAAHGGLNHVVFHSSGEITVKPLTIPRERRDELNSHLMMVYTGIQRVASDVAQTYVQDIQRKEKQLSALNDMVNEGVSILTGSGSLEPFGKLLHEGWKQKRSLSPIVTNSDVDQICEQALSSGATGCKLIGAGGGGFVLLFVPPAKQLRVRTRLKNLIHVPIKFESSGSQIIFFDPEHDYAKEEKARQSQRIKDFRELNAGGA